MAGLKRSQLQQFAALVLENTDKILGPEEHIMMAIAALSTALRASREDHPAIARQMVAEAIEHLRKITP